jgi:transaldolase
MKYFLDSAKLEEIDYAYEHLGIDGVTTNPRHIMLSGKTFENAITDIANWVNEKNLNGCERFPISIEIDPYLEKWQDMVSQAKIYAKVSSNFVIKIPCTEQGIIASKKLEEQKIRTNLTLVFSPSQAIPAGKFGAKFVSPFVGWKENCGDDALMYIKDIIDIFRVHKFNTEIIVAAIRNGKQISDFAKIGADIVTCGLDVYKNSFEHPFTTYGLDLFRKAWSDTAK